MNTLIQTHLSQLEQLCCEFRVKRLELIGSARNDESFHPDTSDIDLLVEFQPLPPLEHGRTYWKLWKALHNLFHRSVDLIETQALKNPYFLANIKHQREVLYEN